MSLLTKASTVTTPTAYSEGLLHSVKPVVNLGSELVTNGDFSDGSTGWTAGTGWSISGGQATHSGSTGNLVTNASLSTNNRYLVTFEIISIDNGVCNIYDTSTATTYASFSTAGIKSTIITKDSSADLAFRSSSSDAVIDNVSIKEVIGADFDFDRASSATRVNEQGLIEKERGNLLLQSNQFDTTWVVSNTSVTSGQSGYDGTSDAWLLDITGGTGFQTLRQTGLSLSGVHTYSIYVKAGTLNWIRIVTPISNTYFDVQNGLVGATDTSLGALITLVNNGYYRCSVPVNGSSTFFYIYPASADNNVSQSSGNLYIQDAQIEQGLVATNYIETTTAAVYEGITDNIPRINYEGGVGSLLLEPSRTNSLSYSEDFSNAAWAKTNSTITINSAESPEGVDNAAAFIENTSSGEHRIQDGISLTSGIDYTFSVFVKANGRNFIRLRLENSGVGSGQINTWFDISNGTVGTSTAGTNSIIDMGNGWYRCISTGTTNTTSYLAKINVCDADNNVSYTGDGSKGVYIYGAMLEVGSYPTSYIPTYGSSVTRVAETCNNAGNSDLFNDSEGVLYAEIAALYDDGTNRYISLSDSTISNRVNIFFDTNNRIRGFYNGLSGSISIDKDITIQNKIAFKYKSGDSAFWVNGFEMATRTDALSLSGLNSVSFDLGGGSDFYGKTKMVATFTEALSDSELECLTSWSSFNRMATAQNYTIE